MDGCQRRECRSVQRLVTCRLNHDRHPLLGFVSLSALTGKLGQTIVTLSTKVVFPTMPIDG